MAYLENEFGINVFNDNIMRERLPLDVYQKYSNCKLNWEPIELDTANVIANALRLWAIERGATHWCHWFQPIIDGHFSEKHEAFLDFSGGKYISNFTGSDLILQEPDASSFPSGGLRATHIARGYTIWDPISPIFIKEVGNAKIMCVPACFISWSGETLDRKTPLLRSLISLTKSAKRLFSLIGINVKHVRSNSGCEQEFYIVDKKHFDSRPDLRITGRTVQGARPVKNQELCDHYLGPIPSHAMNCIHEIEREAWKLGIPLKTRHQEVAPNQFETAPIFEQSSIAADQNLMLMQLMKLVAAKHGLMTLFHEKPFASYNGSGKHNNWSIGTDTIPTVFKPENIKNNNVFKLSLAAIIRAVDIHQDVVRHSIASSGNDFRLGANEAPPSIISIYLGETLTNFVKSIITGEDIPDPNTEINLGIPFLPKFPVHSTDRNRTSPFAFTGNKFEFRAVGSSHNPAVSSTVLNTIMADSLDFMYNEIESKKSKGISLEKAIEEVVREVLTQHQRIIFDGNGYDSSWVIEAEKRGLLNLKNTSESLKYVLNEKNYNLFESQKIFSRTEFEAYVNCDADNYSSTVQMEAQALLNLANRYIIPAGLDFLKQILPVVESSLKGVNINCISKRYKEIDELVDNSLSMVKELEETIENFESDHKQLSSLQKAEFTSKKCVPAMNHLRSALDSLEKHLPAKDWPLPTYEDMLFNKLQ